MHETGQMSAYYLKEINTSTPCGTPCGTPFGTPCGTHQAVGSGQCDGLPRGAVPRDALLRAEGDGAGRVPPCFRQSLLGLPGTPGQKKLGGLVLIV
jgi:hypothetical protein